MTIEPKLMSAEELERIRSHHDGWIGSEQSRLLAHIAAQEQRIVELEASKADEQARAARAERIIRAIGIDPYAGLP